MRELQKHGSAAYITHTYPIAVRMEGEREKSVCCNELMVAMGLRLVSPLLVGSYIDGSFIILGLILNVQLKGANEMQSNDDIERQQRLVQGQHGGDWHGPSCTPGTDKTKGTKCRDRRTSEHIEEEHWQQQ